jgi:3-dehydroquinate synthase
MKTLPPLHQEIRVNFRYGVYFTQDVFALHNPLLAGIMADGGGEFPRKILVVVDNGLYQHHPRLLEDIAGYLEHYSDLLRLACLPLLVPGGEQVKNDTFPVSQVHRAIHANGLCRHSYVVVAGGGAVIDMTGYAAATAHRGVRLIRLPTTVMAQADASIGVKNGINAFGKKNFVGTFAPPSAVINDAHFLTTLSQRDWISGVAEAVKVALIKDASFFAFLEEHAPGLADRRLDLMSETIHRSAELHLQHIANCGDPFELGSSRPLDFGHWSAHKLEQLTKFSLRHGEAVAIGMALDVTYSCLAGELSQSEWNRVITLLEQLGLPIYVPELEGDDLLEGLQEFREHLGGRLTIMLLENIGKGREVHAIDPELVRAAAGLLRERALGRHLVGHMQSSRGEAEVDSLPA